MKKFLFLLLSLAVAATASAGIDRSQLAKASINPQVAKSMLKCNTKRNVEFIKSVSSIRGTRETPTLISNNDILTMYQNEGGYILQFNRLGYAIAEDVEASQEGYGFVYIDANFENAYIMNPVSGAPTGYWMKGTCDENLNITFPLGQYMFWNSTYEYGAITAWGTYADGEFTTDESVTECTFTAYEDEDGYLIFMLDNSSDYTGLALIWDDDLKFAGYLDWNTILYQSTEDPTDVTVAPGSTTADVTWADKYDAHWNLRYRPIVEGGPFTCAFDTQADFDAWDIYDQDGDNYNWFYFENSQCATSESYHNETYSALTPDNWLVSPEVKLEGVLKFTYRGMDANYPAEKFTVYVSTDYNNSIDSFTAISDEITASGEADEMSIDLSAYAGQTGRIAFRHTNVTDQFRLVIDDVFVGDPNFVMPEWTVVENLTDTAYTIEGLTPETNYEVQVQSFNGGGASDWTASTYFTTLPEVPTVYIMGEVNEQAWAANAGTLMDYDSENKVYTATVNIDGRGENQENYFGFTYKLAENADDWDAIESYRFGAVSEGNFWINEDMYGTELSLTRENGQAFRILAGEYKFTVNTETMKLIVEKIGVEPQILLGDVNSDGFVTIADATLLIDYLLGANVTINEDNSDVETNGTISIGDVTALIDMLLNAN